MHISILQAGRAPQALGHLSVAAAALRCFRQPATHIRTPDIGISQRYLSIYLYTSTTINAEYTYTYAHTAGGEGASRAPDIRFSHRYVCIYIYINQRRPIQNIHMCIQQRGAPQAHQNLPAVAAAHRPVTHVHHKMRNESKGGKSRVLGTSLVVLVVTLPACGQQR